MPVDSQPLGIIGVGEIASAIVRGLHRGTGRAPAIHLSPRGHDTAAELAGRFPDVHVCADNAEVLAHAEVVVVAVRPLDAREVLRQLSFRETHVVISVVAMLHLDDVRSLAAPARRVVRAIPPPAVATGHGLTAMLPDDEVSRELFERVGNVVVPDTEDGLDAMSAVTGTLAALVEYVATVARWLGDHDVPAPIASQYTAQLLGGLGPALLAVDGSAGALERLVRNHTTPGGLNAQFAESLRAAGAGAAVRHGLDAVLERVRSS